MRIACDGPGILCVVCGSSTLTWLNTKQRPVVPHGSAKGIEFGFEFIQIGAFRLGAVDDNHFSIARSGSTE